MNPKLLTERNYFVCDICGDEQPIIEWSKSHMEAMHGITTEEVQRKYTSIKIIPMGIWPPCKEGQEK